MADRCTGHCCTSFSIPYSPEELQRALERSREPVSPDLQAVLDMALGPEPPIPEDIETLVDMLVYLGEHPAVAFFPHEDADTGTVYHYYACRHLQPNGDCGAYESRPSMCVRYPYGRQCKRLLCTWDAARMAEPAATAEKVHIPVVSG